MPFGQLCLFQQSDCRLGWWREENREGLERLAAEDPDQLDDQYYYHHQLEHEGSALVELIDHEMIKLFGGIQFLLNQIFVVRDAHPGRCQLVQAGGKHVAEKLDSIVGPLSQFG